MEFTPMPKIARLSRACTITEKIDGTNASVVIVPADTDVSKAIAMPTLDGAQVAVFAGSRNRWVTPADDNYGFARWVEQHIDELLLLGLGRHFGEWWGAGIQRRYDMAEKCFSLFNSARWGVQVPPACCRVVPTLYSGVFTSTAVDDAIATLRTHGSVAAPGFMRPEGVIVYQVAGRVYFKKTLEKDDEPKGKA